MSEVKTYKDAFKEYVLQTAHIRELSSPSIDTVKDADQYREVLLLNFKEIGEISAEKNHVMEDMLLPLLEKDRPLTDEEIEALSDFCLELFDAYSMDNLDLTLRHRIVNKLLSEADKKGEVDAIIRALDLKVESCFALMHSTQRLSPCSSAPYKYRDEGFTAAERLLSYLEKDAFSALPSEELKHIILVDSRYISALFDRSDNYCDEVNASDLALMKRSLSLSQDDFYISQAPNYNWRYHTFRTLQYITNFTELNNTRKLSVEMLEEIYSYTNDLEALWYSDKDYFSKYCSESMLKLYVDRASHLTGRIGEREYKEALISLLDTSDPSGFNIHGNTSNILTLGELLLCVDEKNPAPEDIGPLKGLYQGLIQYVHNMPKLGSLSFMLSFIANILKRYIEVGEEGEFEAFCLKLMAAIHPPTYVHSLSVADFSRCLTSHAVDKKPWLFKGFRGISTEEEAKERKTELTDFAYHASLCHDIGKLFVAEIIMTYGRKLLPEEFELIRIHPLIGAEVLLSHKETAGFANIAKYHHLFYDCSSGYPDGESTKDLEEKAFIDLVAVADCLDASTDSIGRSYKQGKSLEEFLEELRKEKGTRYSDDIVDLFDYDDVISDVKEILLEERNRNYRRAFNDLRSDGDI